MIKNIREFVYAAHICNHQCFNAYQESNHQKPYFRSAYEQFDITWNNLPTFLRKWLTKNVKHPS